MSGLASASTPTSTFPSIKIQRKLYINPCNSVLIPGPRLCSSDLNLTSFSFAGARVPQRSSIICRSSTGPGAPGSGDNESRNVLDAFFLGKALAEALNERIESTIGEFLGAVGRLQAEQQKQVLDFQPLLNSSMQEEVLERAKRAKEKSAREAMEAQGLIPKSAAVNATTVTNGAASKASPPTANDRISGNSSSYNPTTPGASTDPDPA
ncbi:uncharacterized protein At4g13200, chloroplastic isoform X1 [Herrania umbratica]|uniref:Uncharacterized protein At4g13200, chloroplastic isoform X1 n=1 Tax=Herrania umbratica TaxID=108875 RepID=A0A6J0ZG69_9ROSI|nr:uncharacterized protein At4g13200, chloroplastic isoform X1 [Herrania umbratica]